MYITECIFYKEEAEKECVHVCVYVYVQWCLNVEYTGEIALQRCSARWFSLIARFHSAEIYRRDFNSSRPWKGRECDRCRSVRNAPKGKGWGAFWECNKSARCLLLLLLPLVILLCRWNLANNDPLDDYSRFSFPFRLLQLLNVFFSLRFSR